MGNDGGSIPTRRELVKEAARNLNTTEVKETQKEQLAHRWSTCPLSHRPLAKPVVSDGAGNIYNKYAIIQYLLPGEGDSLDQAECDKVLQGRVKSLKDVVEVRFDTSTAENSKETRRICPVTSKELGPAVKAVYIVPCGHAFSREAIQEMRTAECLQCATAYESRDVIPILPLTDEDKAALQARLEALAASGLTHALKKVSGSSKKRKTNGEPKIEDTPKVDAVETSQSKANTESPQLLRTETPLSSTSTPKLSNGIKNAATASLTAKVLEEEEARKRRRVGKNDNLKSLFSHGQSQKQRNTDFMTRGYSIPANARHE